MSAIGTILSIYRSSNGASLARWLARLAAVDPCRVSETRLWALDEVYPSLTSCTMGVSRGGRSDLLARLAPDLQLLRFPVVVLDDDVDIDPRDLLRFASAAYAVGMDIAQPAHADASFSTYEFCRRARGYIRETSFVEIGPAIFLRRPEVFRDLLEAGGMGWGTELAWYARQRAGMRLGIADFVTMHHRCPVGTDYDLSVEETRLRVQLAQVGLRGVSPLQVEIGQIP